MNPRLCGFRRVSLKAGETAEVCIPLDPLTDTVIDDDGHEVKVQNYALYIRVGDCETRIK